MFESAVGIWNFLRSFCTFYVRFWAYYAPPCGAIFVYAQEYLLGRIYVFGHHVCQSFVVLSKCGIVLYVIQGLENSMLSFGQFRVIFWQILRTAEILTEFL